MTITPEHAADLEQLKRALLALRKLRARVDELEQAEREPIAIVGIGCRLPGGADTPAAFWNMLSQGRDAISEVPAERWDNDTYWSSDPTVPGTVPTRYGGFLETIDRFDPHFFGVAPREARAMDPQQRLVLETAWEALEDANVVPESLAGSATGVFIGIGLNDYGRLQTPAQAADPTLIDAYTGLGNALCITANRLSYVLDLHGPSMAIDTACSSSLVAIHQACRSLRSGDCEMALVGGSNVLLAPENSVGVSKFLAPDGRCKFGDAAADGYVRGEGVLMMVLMPLTRARAEGVRIYALIRGSAVNQDGYSSGLTVPNGVAQQAMLRAALADARVDAGQVGYVEAHGTGTALGDPIEIQALGTVLGAARPADRPLLVGSVKANIGHLEAGAGIAGIAKAALALKHGAIPPSLHFMRPNPHIPFERLNVRVATVLTPWPDNGTPRIAGVSSFGFGGTNAHVILEAPPVPQAGAEDGQFPQLLPLSAKDRPALQELAGRYAATLAQQPRLSIAGLCGAAGRARSQFAERAAFVAASGEALREQLESFAQGELTRGVQTTSVARAAKPKVAFLFTGQGAQYPGMGRRLYESEPIFRAAIDSCAELLLPELGLDVRELMFGAGDDAAGRLEQTAYTQPALFALEYALAELWRSWGIIPHAVLGHSLGEYVAACVAGVMSLEDSLRLVAARGRMMGALASGGAMSAIFAAPERVQAALRPYDGSVAIAAFNEPEQVVISGEEQPVEAVRSGFAAQGIKARRLETSHAFHSPLVDPILEQFEAVARTVAFNTPRIPLVANLTGAVWPHGRTPDASYWRRHLREPVQFAAGIAALDRLGCEVFVELGPAPVLAAAGSRSLPEVTAVWAPSLRRNADDRQTMLNALGALYVAGVTPDWRGVDGVPRGHVDLPTYPFQRERYWFDASAAVSPTPRAGRLHPLIDRQVRSPALAGVVFESDLRLDYLPLLDQHRVHGTPVYPAAAYLELALAAAELAGKPGAQVAELLVHRPLALPDGEAATLQVILDAEDAPDTFTILTQDGPGAQWRTHVSGGLLRSAAEPAGGPTLGEAQAACGEQLDRDALYATFVDAGMGYGPAFRGLEQVWRGEGAALGLARLPDDPTGEVAAYGIHPALLDACLQACGALLPSGELLYLPIGVEGFRRHAAAGATLWSYLEQVSGGPDDETIGCRLLLFAPDGTPVAEADRVIFKRAPREARQPSLAQALLEPVWRPQMLETTSEPAGGRWLVVDAGSGLGEALADMLAAAGAQSVLATATTVLGRTAPGQRQVDVTQPEQLRQFVASLRAGQTALRGAVFLGGAADSHDLLAGQAQIFGGALHLAQALAAENPARLWLVTSGAQTAGGVPANDPAHATLWGLGRVVARELPELGCVCVDLDLQDAAGSLQLLVAELLGGSDEDQVALHGGARFVARLAPREPSEASRLVIAERGTLDRLELRTVARPHPGPDEVLIRVHAAGLNFRDVLNALDMYPGDAGGLGHECSGVVEAIGRGVVGLEPGDAVLAIAGDSLGTFALARAVHTLPKPDHISFAQAATIPIAFATAAYGLRTLAGLQAGERVLIHAAAGGVGLAAVQIARRAGAEVIATAGSPAKREFIRSLGVQHVFDSRSTAFVEDVRSVTGGRGVDVVLNSLGGEAIPAGFAVLRDGGRFVEIGKRGIWDGGDVAALGRDIDYHVLYLGDTCEREPELVREILAQLVDELNSGELEPLPLRRFALSEAADAFRYMAQARHIGKIVFEPELPVPLARPDGAYLVTGGLGGLGLAVARWLAENGARNLVLAGRRPPAPEAERAIAAMEASGARVLVAQVDVADEAALASLLERVEAELAPLRGIIHAAGVLDDGPLLQQSWQRCAAVLAPKMAGAWALHRLTETRELDWLIFFSAGAALLGAPGQAGYAAANSYLDSLAQLRRSRGLPALSINWGVWGGAGMAAAMGDRERRRLADQGMLTIAPADGLHSLGAAIGGQAAQLAVLPADWSRVAEQFAGRRVPSLLRELVRPVPAAELAGGRRARGTADGAPDLAARVAKAAPGNRRAILRDAVREQAGRVLGLAASYALDPRRPLSELGLDSLMAVELRNSLGAALGRSLPTTLLFDYPNLDALAGFLAGLLAPPAPPAPERAAAMPSVDLAADLEQLSDSEAEALLLAELHGLKGQR